MAKYLITIEYNGISKLIPKEPIRGKANVITEVDKITVDFLPQLKKDVSNKLLSIHGVNTEVIVTFIYKLDEEETTKNDLEDGNLTKVS